MQSVATIGLDNADLRIAYKKFANSLHSKKPPVCSGQVPTSAPSPITLMMQSDAWKPSVEQFGTLRGIVKFASSDSPEAAEADYIDSNCASRRSTCPPCEQSAPKS
jgi:hypothetical protein